MNTHIMKLALSSLLLTLFSQANAFDIEAGKKQVSENCTSCHGSELYTRSDRRVSSRKGVSTQVQRCQLALNLNWFDEDVENTAEYLNIEYYHFKK
ncbi:cytochrome c [Sedimenticola selenatireducens]|uniref:Cytochrome c n=1 Tax=Sedimenticola selenatireducens TaxID=191960 RepID=A0A557SEV1_9GAMM|nr:cytochrome c [Sedimenticola selenatireducens]TVO75957.1 cytochrome c [Sedimenticola selenatireducens]TVT63816.1 MAG: cytochrome c [Sedimenticola selenatireducens]